MARALWNTAKEMANNPTVWQRIKHSKRADPLRRYQGDIKHGRYKRFAKRLGKGIMTTGVGATFQFIPIPVVKDITSKVYEKMTSYVTAKSHQSHLTSVDLGEKTKFTLKELDVADLDRYRWKIADSIETLNKLAGFAIDSEETTASICNDYGKVMAKYYYVQKRIGKMEAALEGLEEACKMTRDWMKEVQDGINGAGNVEVDFMKISSAIVKTDAEKHAKCDQTFCVNKSKVSWSRKHGTFLGRLSKGVNFVVDVGAPDFTDKDLYGKHDKGAHKGKSSYFFSE